MLVIGNKVSYFAQQSAATGSFHPNFRNKINKSKVVGTGGQEGMKGEHDKGMLYHQYTESPKIIVMTGKYLPIMFIPFLPFRLREMFISLTR